MKYIILNKKQYLSTFKNLKSGLNSLERYRSLFPIKSSSHLAGIVADLTGDGHISQGLIQYISKYKNETLRFRDEFNFLFDKKGKIRKGPTSKNTWECVIGNNALVKILNFSGVPFGNKTIKKFEVPGWVLNGNKNIRSRYIQRLFDCEGSVFLQNKRRIRIKIQLYKLSDYESNLRKYLNQIRKMLSEFGVKTTNLTYTGIIKRKDNTISKGLEFEIYGTKKNLLSILNFQKHINFETKRKAKILSKSIRYLMPS